MLEPLLINHLDEQNQNKYDRLIRMSCNQEVLELYRERKVKTQFEIFERMINKH